MKIKIVLLFIYVTTGYLYAETTPGWILKRDTDITKTWKLNNTKKLMYLKQSLTLIKQLKLY
jgi:hypothetical protein